MRAIGLLLAVMGAVAGLYAFSMDVSVRAPNGAMIHNLELAGERLLVAIFGCTAFISGVVTLGLGEIVQVLSQRQPEPSTESSASNVPFYFRYDPQFVVGLGLVVLAAVGLAAWFITSK